MQNILKHKLPPYFILKLGGNNPYIKFGYQDRWDWQYYKLDKHNPRYTEKIEWINLIEEGHLVLPLRHIRLIYRNKNGGVTHWEFAMSLCIYHGCRATLDTKSYYIYGPGNELKVKFIF